MNRNEFHADAVSDGQKCDCLRGWHSAPMSRPVGACSHLHGWRWEKSSGAWSCQKPHKTDICGTSETFSSFWFLFFFPIVSAFSFSYCSASGTQWNIKVYKNDGSLWLEGCWFKIFCWQSNLTWDVAIHFFGTLIHSIFMSADSKPDPIF